ncbi:MAG: hypothetical protein U0354_16675 [Candidatus Sericytochromatia bacterium]
MSKLKIISVSLLTLLLVSCGNINSTDIKNINNVQSVSTFSTNDSDTLEQAKNLAQNALKKNYRKVKIGQDPLERTVIQAGSTHFNALWARDASYASLGALTLGDYVPVRDNLESLLNYQREDGLIPRRIGAGNNALGIIKAALGIESKPTDNYKAVDFAKPSADTNSLVAWIADMYIEKSKDNQFLDKYYARLNKGMDWLQKQESNGLIVQKAYSDWKDMTGREGKVMYTNIIYYKGLLSMVNLAKLKNDTIKAQAYQLRADSLLTKINSEFWDESLGFYKDTDKLDIFSPDSNCWAVYFGVADTNKANKIFIKMDSMIKDRAFAAGADKPYPSSMVPKMLYLFGMQGYADTFSWPWVTSVYSLAATKVSNKARANSALINVAKMALRDGTFYEIYEPKNGDMIPVVRKFYKAEKDFSWSAGLYVYALNQSKTIM